MFGFFKNGEDLAREVYVEVNYLTKLYGDDAGRIALEKAQRPRLRTLRRRVLQEAARQLANAQERKRQEAADPEPAAPTSTVYAIDDNAHFRLTEPMDRWTQVEPDITPARTGAADEAARFRLSESQGDWTGVEPEMAAVLSVSAVDAPEITPPEQGARLSEVQVEPEPEPEPEPTPAPAEVQLQESVQPEVPCSQAPVSEPEQPPAPVRRARRVVVSRATTFGIELEIDGVRVMFDARADAKVVSALVYALRDS